MNYYNNPLQMLMGQQQQQNPMQQLMSMGTPQTQPIDHNRFMQSVSNLSDQQLSILAMQARQRGISEESIKTGLDFLLGFRK